MTGPLCGTRIVELAGIGPGPFAAMMLSDMGADVIRVDRRPADADATARSAKDPLNRGRRSIVVDLKSELGVEVVLRLCDRSDALIEGFRPGVTERLGLGPDVCLARRPNLVYGRMTGWGQTGPFATAAGHDINYISLSGALAAIGPTEGPPVPPLNLVGDFGGGGMLLAFGIVCGLLEARSSGYGQVIDASMVEGSALLMAMAMGFRARGEWNLERGTNKLDGGAHFYGVYECSDGNHVAVGAIEPQFYAELLDGLGIDASDLGRQNNPHSWPSARARLASVFLTRTRAEWCDAFEGMDACVTPVLDMIEAESHPHNAARRSFIERGGAAQPAPAPRFSRTPPLAGGPHSPGSHTLEILREAGFSDREIQDLRQCEAVA